MTRIYQVSVEESGSPYDAIPHCHINVSGSDFEDAVDRAKQRLKEGFVIRDIKFLAQGD